MIKRSKKLLKKKRKKKAADWQGLETCIHFGSDLVGTGTRY